MLEVGVADIGTEETLFVSVVEAGIEVVSCAGVSTGADAGAGGEAELSEMGT